MGIEHLVRPSVVMLREGQHRIVCPSCGRERKKKTDRTMSVKVDKDGAIYNCWHCQENGIVPLQDRSPVWQSDRRATVAVAPKRSWDDLNPDGIEFLKTRGISEATARNLGIRSAQHFIQSAGAVVDCVVFPYLNKGQQYAAKIRATGSKGFSSHGAPASLWNLQNVEPGDWLIICEGEIDAATLVEAGYTGATSIPSGAVLKVADTGINPEEDGKFRFVCDAKEKIDAAARVVICCDADAPGQAAAEEIARRIGKDRVWIVDYPEGCKDANEVWIKHGQQGIDDLITNCRPWPISGLYDSSHFFEGVDEIYANGMGGGESTGYSCIDDLYTIAPGMLTIVTGHPSSGKSEFVDQIMVNLAQNKKWTHAVCSFENDPRLHIAKLISKYMRKPFFEGFEERMSPEELEMGKAFIREHFSFIYQADGAMATLESIIERLKVAVMRYGIRTAVIDPYNYIQKPKDMAETEWISVMLTKVRLFAQAHGLHIWFVAHPAKMLRNAEGKVPAPGGYDISGSAAWFAKADHGLTLHRPDPMYSSAVQFVSWKSRFSWLGRQGKVEMTYDARTSNYLEYGQDPNPAPNVVFDGFADIGPPDGLPDWMQEET